MKALGSRFSFYAGFVVGTFTLYVFLRQVWFERSLPAQLAPSLFTPHDYQQHPGDDKEMWKMKGSALFNLKHPHHTGTAGGGCVPKNVQTNSESLSSAACP